ncbi:MAG: alpha-N-acetylglucosaminidase [Bacteroidales bacterium]|nr:alpha-N-acetylglucosaminidase [Bacteroidales bacterium]
MKKIIFFISVLFVLPFFKVSANPINGLLERIDKGASDRFAIEICDSDKDFFELSSNNNKILVKGNNFVSIATGINWYLKYYAGIHLSWNNMSNPLPELLPIIEKPIRIESDIKYRYNLNFCTFSYSMAFWDWERWEREIDWMALHGINLSLAITGSEGVWVNVLKRLGYNDREIDDFIAGPAFSAWWLMNNLEGWGGPNYKRWYKRQVSLQHKILERLREYGIEPVLPGYCGMIPSNAKDKLGIDAVNTGLWCGYKRPFFILPNDSNFNYIASIYYSEQEKLFGKTNFYAIDPFHEGGITEGIDMAEAGKTILSAMKSCNKNAVWIVQGWQGNPNKEMITPIKKGDMLILDLHSESTPQWEHYQGHDWAYCMLLNFGGNVGLHGKFDAVIDGFYEIKESNNSSLKGIGMTPEGIENNTIMFELLTELTWRGERFDKDEWLRDYVVTRYGSYDSTLINIWRILRNSIYNAPKENRQQGTHESIFCARPALGVRNTSKWANCEDYYNPQEIIKAATLMAEIADNYRDNNNFEYDLTDILRQAISEKGRLVLKEIECAFDSNNKELFNNKCNEFLNLILAQDYLLSCRKEFMVGNWIESARKMGKTRKERDLYEWNAKVQITTWGDRNASENGGLRDYAHKEWNGILKDLYYNRWMLFFDSLKNGKNLDNFDWYSFDEDWVKNKKSYPHKAYNNVIDIAKDILLLIED